MAKPKDRNLHSFSINTRDDMFDWLETLSKKNSAKRSEIIRACLKIVQLDEKLEKRAISML